MWGNEVASRPNSWALGGLVAFPNEHLRASAKRVWVSEWVITYLITSLYSKQITYSFKESLLHPSLLFQPNHLKSSWNITRSKTNKKEHCLRNKINCQNSMRFIHQALVSISIDSCQIHSFIHQFNSSQYDILYKQIQATINSNHLYIHFQSLLQFHPNQIKSNQINIQLKQEKRFHTIQFNSTSHLNNSILRNM